MSRMNRRSFLSVSTAAPLALSASTRKIAIVAGKKTHGYGQHAHYAGCAFLAQMINQHVPGLEAMVHRDGWPAGPSFFDGADAVFLFADGGDRNPILPHLNFTAQLVEKGIGLGIMHYALIVPKGEPGNRFLDWIGGYYETHWSVNPMWYARFTNIPEHPVTRGVSPFEIRDEWYYHMRFRPNMERVTPLLTAVPPDATRQKKFGPHSGNPAVKARLGMPEHTAWAYERPDGGRGFGFTGGHYHWSFAHDDYRKFLLNALVWLAGMEVPASGIVTPKPTWKDLLVNQEGEMPADFTEATAMKALAPPAD